MSERYDNLVLSAKEGEKEAFGKLYNIYQKKIYRFVYFMVYDEPLAEDITQNTFLKAWNSISRFSIEKGSFQSFLYTIARNTVIDYQRKKKDSVLDPISELYIESGENIENEFIKREEGKKVRKSLMFLPEFDRQLIILRYFEEMSYHEIARVVKKNEGALRVKIHRALRLVKKAYEREKNNEKLFENPKRRLFKYRTQ